MQTAALPSEKLALLEQAFECARIARLYCGEEGPLPGEVKLLVLKGVKMEELVLMDYALAPSVDLRCLAAETVRLVEECVYYWHHDEAD
jgi:hypothetical protein